MTGAELIRALTHYDLTQDVRVAFLPTMASVPLTHVRDGGGIALVVRPPANPHDIYVPERKGPAERLVEPLAAALYRTDGGTQDFAATIACVQDFYRAEARFLLGV